MNKRVVALLAVSGALAVAAAVGYAAIPAANGIISACRDGKGTLKVIDAENGATCPNNQQLVAWNQQGPQGPEGPAGTPGVSGYEWEFDYGAFSSESTKSHVLWCPAGKRALGGGGLVFGASGARVPGVVLDGSLSFVRAGRRLASARP